jgi:hypothetical protein
MSKLYLNHISSVIENLFQGKIDMSDTVGSRNNWWEIE